MTCPEILITCSRRRMRLRTQTSLRPRSSRRRTSSSTRGARSSRPWDPRPTPSSSSRSTLRTYPKVGIPGRPHKPCRHTQRWVSWVDLHKPCRHTQRWLSWVDSTNPADVPKGGYPKLTPLTLQTYPKVGILGRPHKPCRHTQRWVSWVELHKPCRHTQR